MASRPKTYSAYGFSGGAALFTNSAVDINLGSTDIISINSDINPNGTTCYLLLYNAKAANVVVGTTVPFMVIPIKNSASFQQTWDTGLTFLTSLSGAMVMTTVTGTTVPTTKFGVDVYFQ